METVAVEIENISKSFDDLRAVDQISLRIVQGKTLGLIGPNGAGKTTLLRMIATLACPDAGDIRVLGQSVRCNALGVRRMLGFMPAEFGTPRTLSIAEYLDYFASMYSVPRGQRAARVKEVCELTDLAGREDVMVKGLSTGNRQRLLLAKTLIHDPQVLVLDEPASGLDPRARTELRGIVRALASMGKTIIISSHILPDIEEISDQIGIMEAGRLVVDGHIEALRDEHRTVSTQGKIRVPAEDVDRSLQLLRNLSGVTSCEFQRPFLVVTTQEPNRNFVLAEMLKHDVRVLQFTEDEPNLETIFMQSTAGKVT